MAAEDRHKDVAPAAPMMRRARGALISAGALAAAVLALLGLWDRLFPSTTVNVAQIDSVSLVGASTLDNFSATNFGANLPMKPASHAAPQPLSGGQWSLADEPSASPFEQGNGPAPTETPSDIPTPDQGTTPSPAPSLMTESPSPLIPGTAIPSPTPTPAFPSLAAADDAFLRAVAKSSAMSPYKVNPKNLRYLPSGLMTVGPITLSSTNGNAAPPAASPNGTPAATDGGGGADGTTMSPEMVPTSSPVQAGATAQPLAADQAAARLAQALADVAVTGDGATKEPLGWSVAVNLSVKGYAGIPLILTWSLDGVSVPSSWSVTNFAYRVVASTPDDAGSALIWVPRLAKGGQYNVNVELSVESSRLIVARGTPLTLPNG